VAAWIILFLILFAIISPIVSPYTMNDKDSVYKNFPPFIPAAAESGIGFFSGSKVFASQNELMYDKWQAVAKETGRNPIIRVVGTEEVESIFRGKPKISTYYSLEMNRYYAIGIRVQTFSFEEFEAIQNWQNETGIQVIYPWVEAKDIKGIDDDPAIWYKVKNDKGEAKKDSEGNWIPAYSSNSEIEGAEYHSIRIEGDPGTWIYSVQKSGSVRCRFDYYNYYTYLNGHEPNYIFGTNNMGQDLFMAIGRGARFSLIFAVLVSAVNLTIGTIYGAIQGYYGGMTDMLLDRLAEIIGGVPFVVSVSLFKFYLSEKVGPILTFAFAFFLTGWIGMSALVRKQFYRFKGQEYVLAARTLGASDRRLMFKHIFPNSLGTIITRCALVIPGVISSESSLTYLGIIDLTSVSGTSMGTLMSQGQAVATTAPHAMIFPAIFISLLLISFNLFGNGLRDAFNPSMRGLED